MFDRVLLACIQFLAECPCPLCYIRKDQIAQMGTKLDSKRRSVFREDSHAIRSTIKRARDYVFLKGYNIVSKGIRNMLQQKSLQAMRVRSNVYTQTID